MKHLFIAIIMSNFACAGFAQSMPSSETAPKKHYVFRVKKAANPIANQEDEELESASYQDNQKNLNKTETSMSKPNDDLDQHRLSSESAIVQSEGAKKFSRLPRLSASGDYAFMYVSPYEERTMQLKSSNKSFVVYDFIVNAAGKVSSIGIHQTNDQSFTRELVQKLNKTRWQAAVDEKGNPSAYHFGKFIAVRR